VTNIHHALQHGNSIVTIDYCDVTSLYPVVFHCNYISIMHRFRDIISYFRKSKIIWPWTHPLCVGLCISTRQYQTAYEIWNAYSFTHSKDMIGAIKFKNGSRDSYW